MKNGKFRFFQKTISRNLSWCACPTKSKLGETALNLKKNLVIDTSHIVMLVLDHLIVTGLNDEQTM